MVTEQEGVSTLTYLLWHFQQVRHILVHIYLKVPHSSVGSVSDLQYTDLCTLTDQWKCLQTYARWQICGNVYRLMHADRSVEMSTDLCTLTDQWQCPQTYGRWQISGNVHRLVHADRSVAVSTDLWTLTDQWQCPQTCARWQIDNVTVSDFLYILIFLGDGYEVIGSLQWHISESDSLPLWFGHFPILYMKINCMKNL